MAVGVAALLAGACGEPVVVVADAQPDAAGSVASFVVDSLTTYAPGQADPTGIDFDDDDNVDVNVNRLLALFVAQGVFETNQTDLDAAIDTGAITLLANTSPATFEDGDATLTFQAGAASIPVPCVDPAQLASCRQHLDGQASFELAIGTPTSGSLDGQYAAGNFTGASIDGIVHVPFSLGVGVPVDVELLGARAVLTGVHTTGINKGVLGGGITPATFEQTFLPAFVEEVQGQVLADCVIDGGTCTCAGGSSGAALQSTFDTNQNCDLTAIELQSNATFSSLTAPDLDLDGNGDPEVISFGVRFTAVPATLR